MFIEEGVMNFWAMWGALGAFTCSGLLLLIKFYELVKRRRSGTSLSDYEERISYLEAYVQKLEAEKKKLMAENK